MPYIADPETTAFIRHLPKTETHLHIEGALPFELLHAVDPDTYPEPPALWADDFRYDSFDQFMDLYVQYCSAFFTSPERYHEAGKIIFRNCADQGCRYVECSFHAGTVGHMGGPANGPEVVEAIRSAAPEGLPVKVFMGMSHDSHTEPYGLEVVKGCLDWDGLDGIDLHGREYLPVEPWTVDLWQRAPKAGKATKAHAGEFMPARFVRYCVEVLGAQRIQHGVRSVEDPEVLRLLADRGVPLDVCPISNVKLQVEGIPDMKHHPLPQLLDAGVTCTINSDDPFMFGNTLTEDYIAVHQDLGLDRRELVALARNGFRVALMDEAWKAPCFAELDRIESEI
ncbi:MAG: adenosine deaminase family protein [Opitutales bacterium]